MVTTSFQNVPACLIRYKGDVEAEARQIKDELEQGGLEGASLQEMPDPKKSLGAGEIILTVVLSAMVKPVIEMAFTRLLNYLTNRNKQQHQNKPGDPGSAAIAEKAIHLRIVLKNESQEVVGRELLALKEASPEIVAESVSRLSHTALKYIGA